MRPVLSEFNKITILHLVSDGESVGIKSDLAEFCYINLLELSNNRDSYHNCSIVYDIQSWEFHPYLRRSQIDKSNYFCTLGSECLSNRHPQQLQYLLLIHN